MQENYKEFHSRLQADYDKSVGLLPKAVEEALWPATKEYLDRMHKNFPKESAIIVYLHTEAENSSFKVEHKIEKHRANVYAECDLAEINKEFKRLSSLEVAECMEADLRDVPGYDVERLNEIYEPDESGNVFKIRMYFTKL